VYERTKSFLDVTYEEGGVGWDEFPYGSKAGGRCGDGHCFEMLMAMAA